MAKTSHPRPAAALILVRDGSDGIEVFLMQRSHRADFGSSAFVFPGGAVDASDSDSMVAEYCYGLDDATASRRLGVESGGLAYWIAAIRECFEESGLLLACDAHGELASPIQVYRQRVASGELSIAAMCGKLGIRLAADRLGYYSHWIAPPIAPRRYDTRFFIAEAPPEQSPSPDDRETIDQAWIRPADALARHRRGEMELMIATSTILESLTAFSDTKSLLAHARALPSVDTIMTRPAISGETRRFLLPGDAAYAEVGKLDPLGSGDASCEIIPGVVTRLSATVRRIASPNPHFMRGPGTNTYLLGAGEDIAVIDPGPAIDEHVHAILSHADGRIRWILVTHTHGDHSPAARLLKEHTGAELIGMPPPPLEHQDQSFAPDRVPSDGERLTVAGCVLRAIHTPGHASNHLCYLLEDERLLFTGDYIMQGSTVVINPPDGDMRVYLASLRKVQQESIDWLAPGHGFLMDKPGERIDRLLMHRQARENAVLAALDSASPATVEQLLPLVYADVPAERHGMAARSLLAHLFKLRDDGRAIEADGKWHQ